MRQTVLLVLATLVALTVSLLGQVGGWSSFPLAAAVGLVLVWWLPGCALLAALFPRGLGPLVRAALAVPSSFLLCIGVGVVLDRTPIGLHSPGFAVSVALLALLFTALAELRRTQGAQVVRLPRWRAPELSIERVAAPAFGLLFLVGLGGWAWNGWVEAVTPPPKPFTVLALDQQRQILIENDEGVPASYRLELDGSGSTLASWPALQLAPGGRWTAALPEVPAEAGHAQLKLFRGQDSQPYRSLIVRAEEA